MPRFPFRRKKQDHQSKPTEPHPRTETCHEVPLPSGPEELNKRRDLWDQAYQCLREDKTTKELLRRYERILVSELNDGDTIPSDVDAVSRKQQMATLVRKKVELMNESGWTFQWRDETVDVKAQIDRIVKAVLWAKDFISSAVSTEPHASLAWAGVCVILPMLLNPTVQQKALVDGLDYITDLIARFTVIERVYVQQKPSVGLYSSFEKKVTKLYGQVLGYQAQVVCQLMRPNLMQYARDVAKLDDWSALLSDIKEAESGCRDDYQTIGVERLDEAFKEQKKSMDSLLSLHKSSFRKLQKTTDSFVAEYKQDKLEKETTRHTDKELECLRALRTSNYEDYKARNPDRVPGTCQWLLKNRRYLQWEKRESNDLLWVTAGPGCGKSVVAKSLIGDELQSTASRTTCYFFFKDDSSEQKSVANAVCALLHQLLSRKQDRLAKSVEAFQQNGAEYFRSFQNVWALLVEAAHDANAGEVVCILDALDECEDNGRSTLIDALNTLYSAKEMQGSKLKFLVTSRPYYDIENRFSESTEHLSGEDETELIRQEIDLVIKDRVPRIASRLKLDIETQNTLQDRLLSTRHRTYLWLHLTLDDLERSLEVHTSKRMERFLDETPRTVDEAYEKILRKSPDSNKAEKLLQIVLVADRPLTLREMNMALNLEPENKSREDVDLLPDGHMSKYIRNLCGLFVSVYDSKIYLLHQTAREFLLHPKSSDQTTSIIEPSVRIWKHSISASLSHLVLARICLVYLSFDVFEKEPRKLVFEDGTSLEEESPAKRDCSPELSGKREDYVWSNALKLLGKDDDEISKIVNSYYAKHDLVEYAAGCWGLHFRQAKEQNSLVEYWRHVCDVKSQRLLTWMRIHRSVTLTRGYRSIRLSAVTLASYHGHDFVLKGLIKENFHVEFITTDDGWTPLHFAIDNGHSSTVDILLRAGAGTAGVGGHEKPLALAVRRGNEAIVRSLLAAGVQVEQRDHCDCTPLIIAAEYDHEAITEILLEAGASIEARGFNKSTPLMEAARRGSVSVVRLLIDKGADVNSMDANGRTPLLYAVESIGHFAAKYNIAEMVSLLIDKGAVIDAADRQGRTPLSYAAAAAVWGSESSVARTLIEAGASTNIEDKRGRTPLSYATIRGSESVARALIEAEASPDIVDKSGRTPLSYAAIHRSESVVRALIEVGASPDIKDRYNRTPLSYAAEYGSESLARALIEAGASPNMKDKEGLMPLDLARRRAERNPPGEEYLPVIALLEPITIPKSEPHPSEPID
ncbi:MAG: hypothetical protein Q9161_009197 [Pseudevernia consocians]